MATNGATLCAYALAVQKSTFFSLEAATPAPVEEVLLDVMVEKLARSSKVNIGRENYTSARYNKSFKSKSVA